MPQTTLVRNEPAGTQLRLLTFDAAPAGHTRPGQFVTATIGDAKPAFFALASSPGEPAQLLVKAAGQTAEALAALPPGAVVELSDAMGDGFAVERGADRPLVVLVNGTAISAVRPVVRAEIARGLPRPVHLYYGVLSLEHRSFVDELEAWARAGVRVTLVLDGSAGPWDGRSGYVQQAAKDDGLVRDDVTVLACGYPAMIDDAKALYAAAGLPAERLLLNY